MTTQQAPRLRSEMVSAVKAMNEAFGNAQGSPRDFDRAPEGTLHAGQHNAVAWERLQKQCECIGGALDEEGRPGYIAGEVLELLQAVAARDVDGTRDALCDILTFALGSYHFLGYDADADMRAVHDSVMTRFCRDEDELEATVRRWADVGVDKVASHGAFPRVYLKVTEDQRSTTGEHFPRGKFLKSVGHRPPILPPAPAVGTEPRRFFGMSGDPATQRGVVRQVAERRADTRGERND